MIFCVKEIISQSIFYMKKGALLYIFTLACLSTAMTGTASAQAVDDTNHAAAASLLRNKADFLRAAVAGQDTNIIEENEAIFVVVEDIAEFPGGEDSMYAFIAQNLVYPTKALEDSITGTVFVSFVIEKDGKLSNIKILRDIGGGCGDAVVELMRKMPRWKPARQSGSTVRCLFNLPIRFQID